MVFAVVEDIDKGVFVVPEKWIFHINEDTFTYFPNVSKPKILVKQQAELDSKWPTYPVIILKSNIGK